ncbi:hypothetical protein OGAPHI_004510 [Ogataea philodendri]|uniref:Replication termination factor 2 n=1 Tax=Ogataea philodendri TaxID=1378263 RepID=A0A9P8T5V3_9ASCO|nr:uncharacterized protein OGAPHI_004510 [Ogataea philodendri]KAH3666321.1 hypothetical protein OGAPHI_004510 [Ogataea philodendri]
MGVNLVVPVVSDYKGQLFNKEPMIQFLLEKGYTKKPEFAHINTLKDLVELDIKLDGDTLRCELASAKYDRTSAAIPKFAYIVPCGCTMTKSPLIQLIAPAKGGEFTTTKCPICNQEFSSRDVIDIDPDEQELEKLEVRIKSLATDGLTHSLKPRKKRKSTTEKPAKRLKSNSKKP